MQIFDCLHADLGHSGPGEIPHHHIIILQGSSRNHRRLRRHGPRIIQQCQAVASGIDNAMLLLTCAE